MDYLKQLIEKPVVEGRRHLEVVVERLETKIEALAEGDMHVHLFDGELEDLRQTWLMSSIDLIKPASNESKLRFTDSSPRLPRVLE
jgi:hypothetical protein